MPSFPYNPNIPQASDNPADSQGEMLVNFGSINNILAVDHFTFGSLSSTDGQHRQVTLPIPLSGDPAVPPGTAAELYIKSIVSGISQLFFINSGGVNQLTGLPLVTTTPGASGFGLTTPWGIVLNFGRVVGVNSAGVPIIFQVPFPTALATVVATSQNINNSVATVSAPTTTGCTLYSSQNNAVFFLSIGY
jgi:hypothetical protein